MQLPLPENKKLVHQMHIPTRWGDMDALGHINNTVYFRYMEMARIEWLRTLDIALSARGEGVVIVNAFCNFHRQFEYPDTLLVKTYVSNAGRSAFDSWVTMEKADAPGELYATGGATIVCVDMDAQKSIPMPEKLRQQIAD